MSYNSSFDFPSFLKYSVVAILGAAIGAVVGAYYLITFPVKEVTKTPDEIMPALHYVLKGRSGGGDAWKLKASELKNGKNEVVVLETEMNRWASSFSTEYPKEKPAIYIEPQQPLFRLDGDQILVSTRADSGLVGLTKSVVISLTGDFVVNENGLQMEPETLYIGSLRLPGPVKNFVWKRMSTAYTLDAEFQSLWSSIETADIRESQLILTAKK